MAKQTKKEEKAHKKAHHEEDKTTDELTEEMESGELDEDLETEEGRELLVDDDEISPEEAGFSEGASEEGQLAKDALTGEPLMGADNVIELEMNGKLYRFVSQKNAQKFKEKYRKK
ncbi:hypothetical protein HYT52_02625 [Candidatus Woesearchaeota archaeon]|nr:hypothetical protein [Candidatus Woesearchaeota archaeon]